jgi:hypothetical protein
MTAYQLDLDPVHSVIRLTVTAETVTLELAEDIYRHLSEAASSGGPYAAIFDLSAAKRTTIPTDTVRVLLAAVHQSQQEESKWSWGKRDICTDWLACSRSLGKTLAMNLRSSRRWRKPT